MNGILAYLHLQHIAKILDIWACSDYDVPLLLKQTITGSLFFVANFIKSYLLLHSLYNSKTSNKFAELISASLRPGNTNSSCEMSQWWRTISNLI